MVVDNKRIAKNTLILYARMVVMMLVGLYTSRIILQNLGVDDYGIYGAVGGLVGFMGFINAALASSSSRFLTYALGKGNMKESRNTFTTTLTIHIILGLFIFIIGEAIGPWMIANKLVIPEDRIVSAQIAFQFSLITTSIGISQVPYSATIVAHEKMGIYAYMAIWDVIAKLGIALSLNWWGRDKLVFFAGLLFANSVGVMMFYRVYCARKFEEAVTKLYIDRTLIKQIAGFSGWSLLETVVVALNNQGTTVLMSTFFSPSVIAARSISGKVLQMTTQFIGNFRQAANPQIVKLYAANEKTEYKSLVLNSAQYSFYIMWLMAMPIIFNADFILHFWLGTVPEYAVIFVQLSMVDTLLWLFEASFNQGIIATGNIKVSTVMSSVMDVMRFPIFYVLLKNGCSPIWIILVSTMFGALLGIFIKPMILKHQVGFNINDFFGVYLKCLLVVISSLFLPLLYYLLFLHTVTGFVNTLIFMSICVLSTACSIFYVGLSVEMRGKVISFIKSKF